MLICGHVEVPRQTQRHRVEAPWLALPLRPLTALDQEQESKAPGGEARSGGGLGEMTPHIRRKSEFARLTNERDFPHLVELALPPEGFRSVFQEIDAFHRERRIPVRRAKSSA